MVVGELRLGDAAQGREDARQPGAIDRGEVEARPPSVRRRALTVVLARQQAAGEREVQERLTQQVHRRPYGVYQIGDV